MKELFKRNPKQPGASEQKPGTAQTGESDSASNGAGTDISEKAEYSPKFAWNKPSGKPETEKPAQHGKQKPEIPDNLWTKCAKCKELIYTKEFENNKKVCHKCGHHLRLTARERVELLADEGSFEELDSELITADPLGFVSLSEGPYATKAVETRKKTKANEALLTGTCTLDGQPLALAICEFGFQGGSMGGVFGEKMVRVIEVAINRQIPLVTISASGGARMHEGIFSLMQLAKISGALTKLGKQGLPHISLFTDPTLGGVTASYASVADVILAETGALVGFAGPRVIEQTIKQKLPAGFQTAEFQLEHGMVDLVVSRKELKSTISSLLKIYHLAYKKTAEYRKATTHTGNGVVHEVIYAR